MDQLGDYDLYVHLVPGQAPEHLELGALDVEAEQRYGGAVQGQEDGVQGETLELLAIILLLGDTIHEPSGLDSR